MGVLADEGWLCASRRHIGGAGDILAVRTRPDMGRWTTPPYVWCESHLIEVKSTGRSPWAHFGPEDRQAMVETAAKHGAEPYLYWWPPRGVLQRIPATDWPIIRPQPQAEVEA